MGCAKAPRVSQWQTGPAMPSGSAGHALVGFQGQLWAFGGTSWDSGQKEWLRSVRTWRPGEGTRWADVGLLDTPTAHAVAVPAGDGVIVVGGGAASESTDRSVQIELTPALGIAALPALPEPAAAAAGGRVGDSIVVVGGLGDLADLRSAHDRVYRLDLGTRDGWVTADPIPGGPRAIAAAAVVGDELLVFGGCSADEVGAVVNRGDAWAWSAEHGWRPLADCPKPARGMTAVAMGDRYALLVGGYVGDGAGGGFVDTAWIYDRERNRYLPTTPLPTAVGLASVALVGDRVYVVGGEDAPRSRSSAVYIGTVVEE